MTEFRHLSSELLFRVGEAFRGHAAACPAVVGDATITIDTLLSVVNLQRRWSVAVLIPIGGIVHLGDFVLEVLDTFTHSFEEAVVLFLGVAKLVAECFVVLVLLEFFKLKLSRLELILRIGFEDFFFLSAATWAVRLHILELVDHLGPSSEPILGFLDSPI